jgi:hypothetical protein
MFWDYVCFVWLNPLVLGLCVFCLARSTGVRKHIQSKHPWISPNKTHTIQTHADLTKQNTHNTNTCGSHKAKHVQSNHPWISPSKTHTIQTHADLTKQNGVYYLVRSTGDGTECALFGEIRRCLDWVCIVWWDPQVIELSVFCLVKSTGVWIECVLLGEIHRWLDWVCFVG